MSANYFTGMSNDWKQLAERHSMCILAVIVLLVILVFYFWHSNSLCQTAAVAATAATIATKSTSESYMPTSMMRYQQMSGMGGTEFLGSGSTSSAVASVPSLAVAPATGASGVVLNSQFPNQSYVNVNASPSTILSSWNCKKPKAGSHAWSWMSHPAAAATVSSTPTTTTPSISSTPVSVPVGVRTPSTVAAVAPTDSFSTRPASDSNLSKILAGY